MTETSNERMYSAEIVDLARMVSVPNTKKEIIIDVTLEGKPMGILYVPSSDAYPAFPLFFHTMGVSPTALHELKEAELYDIFRFLDVHRKAGLPKSREFIVEAEVWEQMDWVEPPQKIMGAGEVLIGLIGTRYYEKKDIGSTLAVVFISPDNSWTTLTMYQEGDEQSEKTAESDMLKISDILAVYL